MNKWLVLFMQMLPTVVTTIEKVGSHLAGHEKKEAVKDAMTGVASGVGMILPDHAQPAATAAAVASDAIDGVVRVLNEAGVLNPHKEPAAPAPAANPAPAPAPAAATRKAKNSAAAVAAAGETSHLAPQ